MITTSRAAGWWPRVGVAIVLALLVEATLLLSLPRTGGHFTYALDDAYIHLAISRNLAQHGVWGVTRYAAASASSSPLWTLLLAGIIAIVGNQVLLPFLLNLVFMALTAVVLSRGLAKAGFSAEATAGWTFGVVFGGPLLVLAFTGMEHNMHVFFVLLYAGLVVRFTASASMSRQELLLTVALTAGMMLARFESAFLIVVPFVVALRRRDYRFAAALATGPVLALGGFMAYSKAVGMPLVPNSILLKGAMPHGSMLDSLHSLVDRFAGNLSEESGQLLLVVTLIAVGTAVGLRGKGSTEAAPTRVLLWTFVTAAGLQSVFGAFGWFYRYEAYLIVGLSFATLVGMRHLSTTNGAIAAGGLLCAALLLRGYEATAKAPAATQDIYTQQVQMANFIRRYFDRGNVAVNDIGAVTYFTDAHLLDLWGLASDDVRALKQRGAYNSASIADLLVRFRPDAVIVYPAWFQGPQRMPPLLHQVATWSIPATTTAAFALVGFYAANPAGEGRLRQALQSFQPSLPGPVTVEMQATYPW